MISEKERQLCDKLADVWNAFVELPEIYHNDNNDFRFHIDALHRIIYFRPVAEAERTKEKT
jgi:hypothetical protein